MFPIINCSAVRKSNRSPTVEIAALTRLVRPHIALVTTIASAHIEHLGSMEAITEAKAEIFEGLEPDGAEEHYAVEIGAPDRAIILRHLLPNVLGPIIVSITLDIALFMLAEASLSFLGFGVQPGTPTWGNMLNESRSEYLTYPRLAIVPGLTLTIAVLAINFIGDGLRAAFDPRGGR